MAEKTQKSKQKTERGLIGKLYYELKKLQIFNTVSEFMNEIFDDDSNNSYPRLSERCPRIWSDLAKGDYYSADAYGFIIRRLNDEERFHDDLHNRLKKLSHGQQISLTCSLDTILETTEIYYINPPSGNVRETQSYDKNTIDDLRGYYKDIIKEQEKSATFSIAYNIFLLIYLSVYKHLPHNFYFTNKYREDLQEFNTKVLCKYGVTSVPGIRAIVELSKKGNIFALYEHADMHYYGNKKVSNPDYNEALKLYREAAGLNKKEQVDETHCNPLALWSLAYIYYNYQRREESELKYASDIKELDRLTPDERVEFAVSYAQKAIHLSESGPAANILGIIARDESKELCQKLKLETPEFYFDYAAKHDYIYGFTNLALYEKKLLFETDNYSEIQKHLDEYLHNLDKASEECENWASNALGRFYLDGKIQSNQTKKIKTFEKLINPKKALNYFERAIEYSIDSNTAWAIANIIMNFPEYYEKHSEKLKEHIRILQQVNNINAINKVKETINANDDSKKKWIMILGSDSFFFEN